MGMEFTYNPRKAAQAAAYLVNLMGGKMNLLSLIKILYLADRKSLVERGRPITGDAMVSMPHGPVLSRIYDSVKCGPEEGQPLPWNEYLAERENNIISLRQGNPPTDELSEYERGVLQATLEQYRGFEPWELRKITHDLPEYEDPNGSSRPIDPAKILREEGWSNEEIREAAMSAREERFLSRIGK
jgi:uncharacterized phage-associated protein